MLDKRKYQLVIITAAEQREIDKVLSIDKRTGEPIIDKSTGEQAIAYSGKQKDFRAKVSVFAPKVPEGGLPKKMSLVADDDGDWSCNDPHALHVEMLRLHKEGKGIYTLSPANPAAQGIYPSVISGMGGTPFMKMALQPAGSATRTRAKIERVKLA